MPAYDRISYDSDETKDTMGLFLSSFSQNRPKPAPYYISKQSKPNKKLKQKSMKNSLIKKLIGKYTYERDSNEDVDKEKHKLSHYAIFKKFDWLRAFVKKQPPDNVFIVLLDQNRISVDSDVEEYNRKYGIDKDVVLINLGDSKADQNVDMEFANDYYDASSEFRNGVTKGNHKRSQTAASDQEKLENDQDQLDKVILDLEDYKRREIENKKSQKDYKSDQGKLENYQDQVDKVILDLENYKKSEIEKSSGRKRLHNFLPKRYFWEDSDLTKLGYFWYNGPQGKFPGPYRVTF